MGNDNGPDLNDNRYITVPFTTATSFVEAAALSQYTEE
jgi:hypothetical protein